MGVDAQPTMPRNQQFREDLENKMNRDLRPEKYSQEEEKAVAPSSLNTSPPPPQRSLAAMKASLHEVDDLLQNIMYDAGCDEKDIRRTGLSRNPNSPLTDRPAGVDSPGIVHIDQPTPQADTPDFRLTLDGRILRRGDPGFGDVEITVGAQHTCGTTQGQQLAVHHPAASGSAAVGGAAVGETQDTSFGHSPVPNSPGTDDFDQALSRALSHAAMAAASLCTAQLLERRGEGRRGVPAVREIQSENTAAAELLAQLGAAGSAGAVLAPVTAQTTSAAASHPVQSVQNVYTPTAPASQNSTAASSAATVSYTPASVGRTVRPEDDQLASKDSEIADLKRQLAAAEKMHSAPAAAASAQSIPVWRSVSRDRTGETEAEHATRLATAAAAARQEREQRSPVSWRSSGQSGTAQEENVASRITAAAKQRDTSGIDAIRAGRDALSHSRGGEQPRRSMHTVAPMTLNSGHSPEYRNRVFQQRERTTNALQVGERMRGGEFHIDGDTDEHKGMLNKYGLWPNSP